MTETELALANSRPGIPAQVYCILQIGYFKAKHAFFRFDWSEVEGDCAFVPSRYSHGEPLERKPITKHEHYTQRERIAELFGYRPWTAGFLPQLAQQAALIVRRGDVVLSRRFRGQFLDWISSLKLTQGYPRPAWRTLRKRRREVTRFH